MGKSKKILSVAAFSVLLAACGGGDDGANGGGDGGAARSTVTMRDNEFVPSDPVVSTGEVELVNEGASPHTFTVEGEDVNVEIEAGQTVTGTIDLAAGTYTLFCEFHRGQGMEGTLTVEA